MADHESPDHPADQPVPTTGSDLCMPRLGIGTWQLGSGTQEIVEAALELGVRHIDTAQMYGNEDGVGAAVAASGVERDEVFLTTKLGNENHAPEDVRRSVDESLRRLDVDAVDLVLVHWPVDWGRIGETLDALAEAHDDGRIRHLGVSNFTVHQLEDVVDRAPLSCLQVECHPYLTQEELRRWCNDHDWAFTAYSPLAKGAIVQDEVLEEVARDRGATPAQVALAWLLHLPGVAAIPRTSNRRHLESNWAARHVELDRETLERISALDRDRRVIDPPQAPWNRDGRAAVGRSHA